MLKTILRLHRPVARTSRRFVRKVASAEQGKKMIDEESVTKKSDLRAEWNVTESVEFSKFIGQNKQINLETIDSTSTTIRSNNQPDLHHDEIQDVYRCTSASILLKAIKPHLDTATAKYLEAIYVKMTQLGFQQSADQTMAYDEFCEVVKRSPVFKEVLNQTINLSEIMNAKSLVSAYRFFSSINLDPNNSAVRSVLSNLHHNFNALDLEDIATMFRSFEIYSKNPFFREEHALKSALFKLIISKISNGELNRVSLDSLIIYLYIFSTSKQIVQDIIQTLESSVHKLSFRQLVVLINKIKRISNPRLGATDLIRKCNTLITEYLTSDPSEENIMQYLQQLHRQGDREHMVDCLYDPQLINILTPFIRNSMENPKVKKITFNLLHNFGRASIFDESLLELFYNDLISEPQVVSLENYNKFNFFVRYRFPFVNACRLAGALFNLDQIENHLKRYSRLTLVTLAEFVLLDLQNEHLIDLFTRASLLNKYEVRKITFRQFRTISLANVYLSMFSEWNEELSGRCSGRLANILEMYSLTDLKPFIRDHLHKTNSRLQSNAYLSNGLLLDTIAIYDKSTQQLVPMDDAQEEYFHKIDKLPLTRDQQLLTFVLKVPLKGNINQYEYNYNYQLKRVLNRMNIKTVEISKDQIKALSPPSQISFLIEKALDSCNSVDENQ